MAFSCFIGGHFFVKPALKFLRSKVIPWTTETAQRRLIVARPFMDAAELPEGVTLSPRKIRGKRIILKNRRKHANQRVLTAEWPESNLHEIALPKLVCVVDGCADYLLGEYSVRCGEGNFILIPPRTLHQKSGPYLEGEQLLSGSCTLLFAYAYSHGIYFWFSRSRSTRHTNEMSNNYLIPNAAAVQILNVVMEEAVAGGQNYEFVCNNLLSAFFTILAREIESGHYMQPGPSEHSEMPLKSSSDFGGQLQEYIAANFNKPLRLEGAAAQMYLSPAQFARRVRRETNLTFVELLTRYRLERAQELLRETDWTATAIASYVGFRSSTYFQDLFRRRVGCTPMEYRSEKRRKKAL